MLIRPAVKRFFAVSATKSQTASQVSSGIGISSRAGRVRAGVHRPAVIPRPRLRRPFPWCRPCRQDPPSAPCAITGPSPSTPRLRRFWFLTLAGEPFEQHFPRHDHRIRIGDILPRNVGRQPCVACAMAWRSPAQRPGASPNPPTRPAPSSVRISPKIFVVTTTSYCSAVHHQLHHDRVHHGLFRRSPPEVQPPPSGAFPRRTCRRRA